MGSVLVVIILLLVLGAVASEVLGHDDHWEDKR